MGTGAKTTHQTYAVAPTQAGTAGTTSTAAAPAAGASTPADPLANVTTTVGLLDADPVDEPAQPPDAGPEHLGDVDADPAGAAADAPPDVTADQPDVGVGEPPPPDVGADREAPLLPIPQHLPVGQAVGTPALVGGADLVDAAVTLVAYDGSDGPREVLLATVDEAAEAKLLAALDAGEEQFVATEVEQEVNGRLPLDEQQQLHEQVAKVARSVNARLKKGEAIPEHVQGYLATAEQAVAAVQANPDATTDELGMAAHYQQHLDAIRSRVDGTVTVAYADGGKIPQVDPYLHTGTATVTVMVAVPPEPGDGLAATIRPATRINADIDPTTGHTSWDGTSRSAASRGAEYAIDLGDGFTAVYRPYTGNDPTDYSLRGKLELIAPAGTGHAGDLVERLGRLNLVNRPMSASEGEWSYLRANITAQGLGTHPTVADALSQSAYLEDQVVQELFYSHAHEAVGLDEPGLAQMARRLQLEAAARVLPKRVSVVRNAVAAATGHADGAALAASAGYDPTPVRSGGWLTWSRFDVQANPTALQQAWKGRRLVHRVTSGAVAGMLATGVLASTERRAAMGTATGLGSSEDADKASGGANAVFLRVKNSAAAGPALVWDDPQVLMRRTDVYGYDGDYFGALNPEHHKYSPSALTRDPLKIAKFGQANNEVMFRDGIDLLGAEAPSRILCGNDTERQKVLQLLTQRGITHLRGRPVDQVVQ